MPVINALAYIGASLVTKKVFYKMKLWLKLFIGQEHILGAGQAGTIKLLAVLINASLC
jgi:hypothetical protein